ncbi:MAG TPA: enolase C-terminal domain-like protein [Thermodesulfobacteriota bacterium]
MSAPRLRVLEVRRYEREVRLRMPFRFGVVTLTEAREAYVRLRVEVEGRGEAEGVAAELLAPKWFDKNLALTNEENAEQLRQSLRVAAEGYLADREPRTAFGLFAAHHGPQVERCRALGLNSLIANYGPALLDRAVLDALCRACGVSFYEAVRSNLPGIDARLAPDLAGFDLPRFLAGLAPAARLHVRHTVGLADPITAADLPAGGRVGDGLPETLEEVVAAYGHTYFKLKVSGEVVRDVDRLAAIAAVLDRSPRPYHVTLDGNEQYADADGVLALWHAMAAAPRLARLADSILFVEQPVARGAALASPIHALARVRPVIIDESDADLDAFVRARSLGYRGVSSKTCKGVYRSLLNATRAARWNLEEPGAGYFMSGEDLTTQAGVSVQQDLALVALLGLGHVERNGHHYVNGMAGRPRAEQAAFLAAHPDLYRDRGGVVGLRIDGGEVAVGSLGRTGFAVGAEPEWPAMREMA